MENGSSTTKCEWNGGVAYWRVILIEELRVPPDDFVVKREVVNPGSKIERIAILSVQRRASEIKL
jgi:hypothetical protein